MHIKQAIENINDRVHCAMNEFNTSPGHDAYDEESLAIAIEAMKKQVPMKPVPLKCEPLILIGWEYSCPVCEYAVGFNKYAVEYTDEDQFCPSCGQKLDWED